MKKLLIALVVMASAVTISVSEAEAKRLGGGGSIGKQSQGVSRQAPTQSSQAARPAAPATAPAPAAIPPKPASPWRGILGGALLGLGLGALLSHFGLSGAMAGMISTILMVALLALAAMFIFRMFKRKNADQPRPAYAGSSGGIDDYSRGAAPAIGSRLEPQAQPTAFQADPMAATAGEQTAKPWGIPADFDVPAFLRNAKTYFIRLQAAWDKADVTDIREFTTTEMFAELKMQLQERGASANTTDVVTLDAELMGVETVGNEYLASVKFTGMIKEEQNAPATSFSEVWNLAKPVSGPGGWVLAGIQQLA
jgi:predicted lipid-binding transport protein (Tim44 family)